MKTIVLMLCIVFLFATVAIADQTVKGHYRGDGTYVQPYHRSSPDSSPTNNYDFKGNTNPHTGQEGTDLYRSNPKSPYYDGSTPNNLFK